MTPFFFFFIGYLLAMHVQPQSQAFFSHLVTNYFSALVLNWVGFLEEATFSSLSI